MSDIKKSPSELPFRSAQNDDFDWSSVNDNIIPFSELQVKDLSEHKEIEKKFLPKKRKNELLADSFFRLGAAENDNSYFKKVDRLMNCGTFLEFRHDINCGKICADGKLTLANFCRERLCPSCAWRRSLKVFSCTSSIMAEIYDKFDFVALTLTVPNCDGSELSNTIDRMMKAFHYLMKYKAVNKAVKGFFRCLEITYNKKADTYHPHFHCVLAVPRGYPKSRDYINHQDWLELWRKAYKDPLILIVDVRMLYNKHIDNKNGADVSSDLKGYLSAVPEFSKYAVKDSDYIFEDIEKTDKIVYVLSKALKGRRLVQYGGIFKEVFKKLRLEDPEAGDLIHINNDDILPELQYLIVRYGWQSGIYVPVNSYIQIGEFKLEKLETIRNSQYCLPL